RARVQLAEGHRCTFGEKPAREVSTVAPDVEDERSWSVEQTRDDDAEFLRAALTVDLSSAHGVPPSLFAGYVTSPASRAGRRRCDRSTAPRSGDTPPSNARLPSMARRGACRVAIALGGLARSSRRARGRAGAWLRRVRSSKTARTAR